MVNRSRRVMFNKRSSMENIQNKVSSGKGKKQEGILCK